MGNTASGVAGTFLTKLYQLDFKQSAKFAVQDALMQTALLEGAVSENEELKNALPLNQILLLDIAVQNESAQAAFEVIAPSGERQANTLFLKKTGGLWKAESFEKPIASEFQYGY